MDSSTKAWQVTNIKAGKVHRTIGDDLLNDRIAGICIDDFVSALEISKILAALREIGIEYYDGDDKSGAIVRKGKVGPNYYRFKEEPDEYFARTKRDLPVFEERILSGIDLLGRLHRLSAILFGAPVSLAEHRKIKMMPCTIRDLPVAPPHRDWLKGEVSNLDFLATIEDQLAWNIYLTTPEKGGKTGIFKTQRRSDLEKGVPVCFHPPKAGQLLLFRSTNIHEVRPTEGARYTLSGFFGRTSDCRLLFWV